MAFQCEIPVRYGDCDYAKIVYYPRFQHFCHIAMEKVFSEVVGTPYHQVVMTEQVVYPTVHAAATYRKPVGFGETLVISVVVERLGTHSVDFRFDGKRSSDGQPSFVIRSRCVAVAIEDWHAIPLPDEHRKGFEKLLEA